jgi:hypothetical protein
MPCAKAFTSRSLFGDTASLAAPGTALALGLGLAPFVAGKRRAAIAWFPTNRQAACHAIRPPEADAVVDLFVRAASHHSALSLGLGLAELGALRGGILLAVLDAAVDTDGSPVGDAVVGQFERTDAGEVECVALACLQPGVVGAWGRQNRGGHDNGGELWSNKYVQAESCCPMMAYIVEQMHDTDIKRQE